LTIEQPRLGPNTQWSAASPAVARCRERPRRRGRGERQELAPFQLIEMHSIPASQGRFAGYRIGEEQSAVVGTVLQPLTAVDARAECGKWRANSTNQADSPLQK
jgi:hypothetical protein